MSYPVPVTGFVKVFCGGWGGVPADRDRRQGREFLRFALILILMS